MDIDGDALRDDEGGDAPCWADQLADGSVHVRIARVYDPLAAGDGHRVLIDRLWPRGVRRDDLSVDEWCKDVAPSTELRRWYGHRADRWIEFAARYREELDASDEVDRLAALAAVAPLTLVSATKDLAHSNAAVLQAVIEEHLDAPGGG